MAVSGWVGQKSGIANIMPGTHFFPFSYCARCPLQLQPADCSTNCARFLERSLTDSHGGVTRPAAVIMEVIQGEGGVVPATLEFVRAVRMVTKELGVPLILDEIQTGCGRTGTWLGFEHYDIEPDIILLSKGLSGIGMPVSIMMYKRELDSWGPGAHTGTFRGNQLAFAAGVEAVKVVRRDGLLAQVVEHGLRIGDRLRDLHARTPCVGEVRGRGLMWGIEMVDPHTGKLAPLLARAVQREALSRGLIVELGGREDAVVRILPPLIVTPADVELGIEILERAVETAPCSSHAYAGVSSYT